MVVRCATTRIVTCMVTITTLYCNYKYFNNWFKIWMRSASFAHSIGISHSTVVDFVSKVTEGEVCQSLE